MHSYPCAARTGNECETSGALYYKGAGTGGRCSGVVTVGGEQGDVQGKQGARIPYTVAAEPASEPHIEC